MKTVLPAAIHTLDMHTPGAASSPDGWAVAVGSKQDWLWIFQEGWQSKEPRFDENRHHAKVITVSEKGHWVAFIWREEDTHLNLIDRHTGHFREFPPGHVAALYTPPDLLWTLRWIDEQNVQLEVYDGFGYYGEEPIAAVRFKAIEALLSPCAKPWSVALWLIKESEEPAEWLYAKCSRKMGIDLAEATAFQDEMKLFVSPDRQQMVALDWEFKEIVHLDPAHDRVLSRLPWPDMDPNKEEELPRKSACFLE